MSTEPLALDNLFEHIVPYIDIRWRPRMSIMAKLGQTNVDFLHLDCKL